VDERERVVRVFEEGDLTRELRVEQVGDLRQVAAGRGDVVADSGRERLPREVV
jgi:hypothetical protein